MSVWWDDSYTIGKEKHVHHERGRACFYDLLEAISRKGASDVKVDLFIFKNKEHALEGNRLRNDVLCVPEEDMYRYLKLASNLFELPEITIAEKGKYKNLDLYNDICDIYVLSYDFTGKSYIYIKAVLTYVRYLFEDNRGFGKIVRAALDHSEKLPEIPFIEVFAICHISNEYKYQNSNHSLMLKSEYYGEPEIYTEAYLIEKLKDSKQRMVHHVFGLKYNSNALSRLSSTQKITEEVIINFKRVSC